MCGVKFLSSTRYVHHESPGTVRQHVTSMIPGGSGVENANTIRSVMMMMRNEKNEQREEEELEEEEEDLDYDKCCIFSSQLIKSN